HRHDADVADVRVSHLQHLGHGARPGARAAHARHRGVSPSFLTILLVFSVAFAWKTDDSRGVPFGRASSRARAEASGPGFTLLFTRLPRSGICQKTDSFARRRCPSRGGSVAAGSAAGTETFARHRASQEL